MGKGAALSALAFPSGNAMASRLLTEPDRDLKNIRIGIIGAENSHTIGFGKMFNVEKKFPGVEVKYVWGETDAFAQKCRSRREYPKYCKGSRGDAG